MTEEERKKILQKELDKLNGEIRELQHQLEVQERGANNLREKKKEWQDVFDRLMTRALILDERVRMVEKNRALGSDAEQRRKFQEDSLPRPAYRVHVSNAGEVYQD